jgi:ATP-binding cassette subfamily B protein RaxB
MSLSKTAEHAGLKSRALALDLDEIKQLKLPASSTGDEPLRCSYKVRKNGLLFTIRRWVKRIGINEMSNNLPV